MKSKQKIRTLFVFLIVFGACKTQVPPEPRYVDYVPYFDQTRTTFLKSPKPGGAKNDTLVCIWSNLREENFEYTDTLLFDQVFDLCFGNLIIDIEQINEKPPRLDTLLLVDTLLFTRKMVDTYFPLISDSVRELFNGIQNAQLVDSFLVFPDSVSGETLRSDTARIQPADTLVQAETGDALYRPDSSIVVDVREWYSREDILSDTLRDLFEADSIIQFLLHDLGFGIKDSLQFSTDFPTYFLDSMIYVATDTLIVEVRDPADRVIQRPLHELSEEIIFTVEERDTFIRDNRLSFQVFHPNEQDYFLTMVRVRGGSFQIGSDEFDLDERPAYSIDVPNFLMAKYEMTNRIFAAFLSIVKCDSLGNWEGAQLIDLASPFTKIQKSLYSNRFDVEAGFEDHPVVNVTWEGARLFCVIMGGGRLPTEAEWEYAAKGGVYARRYLTDGRTGNFEYVNRFAGSNRLREIAWFVDNSAGYCRQVGLKKPNELGIHDMSGNVWEWCVDKYNDEFYQTNTDSHDPKCLTGPAIRVNRGGSWSSDAQYCRNSNRNYLHQNECNPYLGFRYVKSLP
ncbi:MAG TPA: SUMF1/EgtB/PvdO family nonheme iron enzyme [Prolixibacteraceae bacterium]|nr:SUMF1/EgtB/PvdO family nonheme iron enzyme [Prolixibacteraceae bacterium]